MSVVLNAIAVDVLGEESGSLNADSRANLLRHDSDGYLQDKTHDCDARSFDRMPLSFHVRSLILRLVLM